MLIWGCLRWIRKCFLSVCEKQCSCLVRSLLLVDYVVLYLFFFIFFSINMANIFSNLPQSSWMDPDTVEQQFRDNYAKAGHGRRLAGETFPMSSAALSSSTTTYTATSTRMVPTTIAAKLATTSFAPVRMPMRNATSVPALAGANTTTFLRSATGRVSTSLRRTATSTSTTFPSRPTFAARTVTVTVVVYANATTTVPAASNVSAGGDSPDQGFIDKMSLRRYPFVRWTSILAPFPVFATWLICAWDTWLHAKAIWHKTGSTEAHDLAIQIIALPMVYGLLSLSALVRMWKIMSNFFGEASEESWSSRRDHALEIYEADYLVADLYESWALHHFAVLAMQVLRRSFNFGGSMLGGSASALDTASSVYQAWAGTLKGLHKSVRSLTMQGIWSFVIVCLISSAYGLTAPIVEEMFEGQFPEFVEAMKNSNDKVRFFFLGTGSVASTAAICNILQIERTFHYELLHFKPRWKFWGTKILVSIAFLQSLLFLLPIPPFRYMSTEQANLTYSTLLCYECLLIGLLHMYAWHPGEDWYKEGVAEERAGLTDAVDLSTISLGNSPPLSPEGVKAVEYGLRRSADVAKMADAA